MSCRSLRLKFFLPFFECGEFSFEAVNLGFDFAEFVLGFLSLEVLFAKFCGDVSLKLAS